jgi:hypothetical protein
MAKLDWSQAKILKQVVPGNRFEWQLNLQMGLSDVQVLGPYLEDVYLRDQGELRVDLGDQWTLFWKKRDFESRSLMAHPNANEWVLTLALTEDFGNLMIDTIKRMRQGDTLVLSQTGPLGRQSNADLMFKV